MFNSTILPAVIIIWMKKCTLLLKFDQRLIYLYSIRTGKKFACKLDVSTKEKQNTKTSC